MKRGKAKVASENLCLPKYEGGLGIRNLEKFNIALMTTHIWNIITHKESMWVRWIHAYKLKGRSFWDVPSMLNVSWGWRKLMQIREIARPFFWHNIGNGRKTSFWFDNWSDISPLRSHFTVRNITSEGFNLHENVADMVSNGTWTFPIGWLDLFPVLNQLDVPAFSNTDDQVLWRNSEGNTCSYAVKIVWESIRPRGQEVDWFHIVWHSSCIPRHAFLLWLIMIRKLKTQDKMRQWDVGEDVDLNLLRCPLCKLVQDSHEHLFFECTYSLKVWRMVVHKANLHNVPSRLIDITAWLIPNSNRRLLNSVVSRLVFAASAYLVWQERNNRIHSKDARNEELISDTIIEVVRLKISTLHLKKTSNVVKTLAHWHISSEMT